MEIAEANAKLQEQPVRLAPEKAYRTSWNSGYAVNPFSVSLDEKTGLLLKTNAAALKVKGARFVSSYLLFVREDKFFCLQRGLADRAGHCSIERWVSP